MKVISRTTSVCPECLRVIQADHVLEDDNRIYMKKTCPEHGEFSSLIWDGDEQSYLEWDTAVNAAKIKDHYSCPENCGLCPDHQSEGCCVIIEVTKRCNLRCPVCFASAGTASEDVSLDEIEGIYDLLRKNGSDFNIQLSGGEPTLRDDLDKIVAMGKERGFTSFQLNTNGLRIAEEEAYAKHLKDIGITWVFLQFDGTDDSIYRTLRGKELLEKKLAAIKKCREASLPVELVATLVKDVNTSHIGHIIRFALANSPEVRGVHFQPMCFMGRHEISSVNDRVTIPFVLRELENQTGGILKATDFYGGGAESSYCSFHASYIKNSDELISYSKKKRNTASSFTSSETREFVSGTWGYTDDEIPDEEAGEDIKNRCCTDEAEMTMDDFLRMIKRNTFVVSGMEFMDAYNLDLERLRRCYIIETDRKRGMVPFCAYNLTNNSGEALYRK